MDEDADAVGLNGYLHRRFLAEWYAGDFPGSWARGLVFQHNPQTGDARTSGTAASLVGLEAATEGGSERDLALALARLRLAHAMILGWGGIPVLWSGDELGQPNDPHWADEPGHENDNRWANRPRLDWVRAEDRHDGDTVAGRVFGDLVALVRARCALPHLHASIETRIGPVDDPGILVTIRDHPLGRLVGLYNVTPETRRWPGWRVHELGMAEAVDAVTGAPLPWDRDGDVHLLPYAALWLTIPSP
jgi:amylosucrase